MKKRLIAIALPIMLSTACGQEQQSSAVDPTSRPVKLISLTDAASNSGLRYPAVVDAARQSELSFLVGGTVSELPVKTSEDVTSGTVIARLNPRDFENQRTQAKVSFDNAEEEYQRALRLAAEDAIAQNVLEQRKAQRDVAKAQLDSAEKALTDSIIRAPFDGAIASITVEEQQTVSPGSTIATVIDVSLLEATINVPASLVAQVPAAEEENRKATIELDVAPGKFIEANFSEANLLADATSQTYAVTFEFSPPDNLLVLPGMNGTIRLNGLPESASSQSVLIPLSAVHSDGEGQYVWYVDEDYVVSKRMVQIADGVGENVRVLDGLAAGDTIVGAGGAYLAEGVTVTPWNG